MTRVTCLAAIIASLIYSCLKYDVFIVMIKDQIRAFYLPMSISPPWSPYESPIMAIKLYGSRQSSCTQRVLMMFSELDLEYELSDIKLEIGEHKVGQKYAEPGTVDTLIQTTCRIPSTCKNITHSDSFPQSMTMGFGCSSRGRSANTYSPSMGKVMNFKRKAKDLRSTLAPLSRL